MRTQHRGSQHRRRIAGSGTGIRKVARAGRAKTVLQPPVIYSRMVGSRTEAARLAVAAESTIRLRATQAAIESAGQRSAEPLDSPVTMAAADQTGTISTMQETKGAAAEEDGAVLAAIPVWQQRVGWGSTYSLRHKWPPPKFCTLVFSFSSSC